MSLDQEYIMTKRRVTDEIENDDITINTKDVLMYGYDYTASAKVKINVTSAGTLGVAVG
jgi:hypothetical protein